MEFSADRVQKTAQAMTDEYLMDSLTVYRTGLEPAALPVLEQELARRGFSQLQLEAHMDKRQAEGIVWTNGIAVRCSYCDQPAVTEGWGWHKMWGVIPAFPRRFACCGTHRGKA